MTAIATLVGIVAILAAAVLVLIVQFQALSGRLLDERRYSLLESMGDGVYIVNRRSQFTHINEHAENLLRVTAAEVIGKRLDKVLDPLASDLLPEIQAVHRSGEPLERVQYFASRRRWIEIRIQPALDEVLVYLRDISDRKRAENMLRDSERRLRLLLDQVPALLWTIDLDAMFTSVVGTALAYHGLSEDQLAGETIDVLVPDEDSRVLARAAVERVLRGESERFEVFFNERWLQHHVEPLRTSSGAIIGAIGVALDITEIKEAADHLSRLARVDALTQLPNRLALSESIETRIAREEAFGVLFVDLDRFKMINDTLGHRAGDELLRAFGERLRSTLAERAVVFRSGGDEFVVLASLDATNSLPMIAADIQLAMSEPFLIDDRQLFMAASIGSSAYPEDGRGSEELLTRADGAMYRAKHQGRSRIGFDIASEDASPYRLRLEQDLHYAIPRGELCLVYQPILDIASKRVLGAEALLRWHHDKHGEILPEEFIGIAEQTGMIVAISRWVLKTACLQAATMRRQGHSSFRIAVNLSARDFGEADLADSISAILEETNLPPDALDIEITESMMIDDVALMTMRTLRNIGVGVIVDDFGIAYSSLGYLKRLPISGVKIDRGFIRDIADGYDRAIVRAIVSLARSLDLRVIAEGVEVPEQWEFVRSLGCDAVQGFYFGKPVAPDCIVKAIESTPLF